MFQPGGLGRQCRWGSETAGCGCPAAAGGEHWLLVGSEPLPEAGISIKTAYAESSLFWSACRACRSYTPRALGFISGSGETQERECISQIDYREIDLGYLSQELRFLVLPKIWRESIPFSDKYFNGTREN